MPRVTNIHQNKKKQIEIETLFNKLKKLEKDNIITIKEELGDILKAEGHKRRSFKNSKIISHELKLAIKELKDNENIVIRKADKANVYVSMNKIDYKEKLDKIVKDKTKFKKINKDPTDKLKDKLNKHIDPVVAECGNKTLNNIVGDYTPGYIYGNVKTHKANNPLRPIISQIGASSYEISKILNKIIKPYIPSKHSINSTYEFLDIIRTNKPISTLASLEEFSGKL